MSQKIRALDQEEEVVPAIRGEDADWKIIQQNTFTRWVANHLRKVGENINNLETDFSDGLKLISLAAVLSQKNLGKFNKKVTFRSQKLENVSLALNFFQKEENIKIINIDSSHIVDHNKKLIMGLIWTLILHYSISMGWIQERSEEGAPQEETPKQKLLNWVRNRLPGVPVSNFTSDWNDGVALGALVNSMAPGALPDWENWSPKEALRNTDKAMKTAQDLLNVAPLITPSELIHPEIDEMSVMTYLAQFPATKPVVVTPKVNAAILNLDEKPIIGQPSEFDVKISLSGYKPKLSLRDAEGNDVHSVATKVADDVYRVKYTPQRVGPLKIDVSVIEVESFVATPIDDASRVVHVQPLARLCEYPERVKVGDNVKFKVADAEGPVDVIVVDPVGAEHRLPILEDNSTPALHSFEYDVLSPGLHSVNVFNRKAVLPGSPFPLRAQPKNDFKIWGRGTVPDGVRQNDKVQVHVKCNDPQDDIREANVALVVLQPDGNALPVTANYDDELEILTFDYQVAELGEHEVTVKSASEPVKTFKVNVAQPTTKNIRAFGPGLEHGIVDEPSVFKVETNGESDGLAFMVEGPSKTDIECQDRGNGAAVASYVPKEEGVYKVSVLADGEHIKDSPFVLYANKHIDGLKPSAARVTGLDEAKKYIVDEKVSFRVDTRLVGADVIPKVTILNSQLLPINLGAREVTPSVFEYSFTPKEAGKHHVDVSVGGVSAPGAPFELKVAEPSDPSKLFIYGRGVDGPVYAQEPTHFTIDAKQAGPGAVEVALKDNAGEQVDIDVLDNTDGSFTVKYTAPRPGSYQLNVVFAGEQISPIEINVKPRVDVSGVRVEGFEDGQKLVGASISPVVDLNGLKPQKAGLVLTDEVNGEKCKSILRPAEDGTYTGNFNLLKPGKHNVELLLDDVLVKKATFDVKKGTDVSQAKISGPGLSEAVVGEKSSFDLDLNNCGEGSLHIEIEGPSKSESSVVDNGHGKCAVDYIVKEPGDYNIAILFGEKVKQHIKGSPFKVKADYKKNPSKVKVEGLDRAKVRSGEPLNFKVDTSKTKDLPVTVSVPADIQRPTIERDPKNPHIHYGKLVPVGEAGSRIPVEVLYDDEPVHGSPFNVQLLPNVEPNLLKFGSIIGEKCKDVIASNVAHLPVDVRECGQVKDVGAEVVGPDGRRREHTLKPSETNGVFDLEFPTDVSGEYTINVYVNGVKVEQTIKTKAKKVGSKKTVTKADPSTAAQTLEQNKPINLAYSHPDQAFANLSVIAARPDAVDLELVRKSDPKSGTVEETLVVKPTKPGVNSLDVYYGGEHVDHVDYETLSPSDFAVYQQQQEQQKANVSTHPTDDVEKYEKLYYQGGTTASNSGSRRHSVASNNNCDPNGNELDEKTFYVREFKFAIEEPEICTKDLTAFVMAPSNKQENAEIIDNHDGTILVKYQPTNIGSHELSILQNGAQLQGTPIKFYVDSYGSGYATVYGPGLQNAVVGEPAAFTVCAKGSQAKELSVTIEGPAQSNIKIHDNKDGTCSVTWVPPVPGEYKVHVKLGGKDVRDSPFKVLVMGEGQKHSHLSVGSTSEVALNIAQGELKGISASIKSPSGIEEPCFVRLLDGGKLGVSFTPREAGDHLITVKRDGKLLPKAPFKIKVDRAQVGDASKVEVSGEGKAKAITLHPNELLIDTSKAGYGGLSISMQGPSKADLTCKEVKPGLIKVLYTPTEPGVYAISIKFADHHVRDSPLTVQCTGKGAGRVIQTVQKVTEQVPISLPGQESQLFLKLPNTSPMNITAKLMDPKGHTDDVEMRDLGEQYYQIKFTPAVEGVHTLSVMHKDAHVNGSPFQFTVGSFSDGGAHKVRAAGLGVVRGETASVNSFNIYSREAGIGKLAVTVEGPSKAAMEFKDHKDGNTHVEYKVQQPGEYTIAVKFNDQHIPDSPFKVFVAPATGEVRKLELAQFHDQGIPSGKAFTFTVLTHRAKGHLEAKVVSPNNEVDTIDIVPIEEGESYALRFVPKDTGNHYIHVTLDGAPMRDSPFRLRVGCRDLCDPTAISASGEGLVKGTTGNKCEFVVSTANAGAGILQVQMDGPSKATLDAYELDKGYKVRYTPLAPGDYFCAVKYNGIHVPGSPFKIPVDGKVLGGNGFNESSTVKIDAVAKTTTGTVAVVPEYSGDASKVTAKGAGLNKFFPGRAAAFQIDTGLAGHNLLLVGVVTTKGPCEEVVVRHQGQGHYVCSYKIPDRVKGFIFIRYGDKEIPGSPFAIAP